MAKGRKLSISRSERFLGGYNNNNNNNNGHVHVHDSNVHDSSEFREEDVWLLTENGEDSRRTTYRSENGHVGGVSLAFQDSGRTAAVSRNISRHFQGHDQPRVRHVGMSAPVNVPDWSKILRVDSGESLPEIDDVADSRDSEMVPPHEYLAREYARSRNMAATSVFEGVGRTLKGRDLRRVRDAVWSQTGFDG